MQILTMSRGTSREILRRTNSAAQQRFESPAAPQIYHLTESLPQVSRSTLLQILSDQAEKLPCMSDNGDISQYSPLPSLGSSPISPSYSGQSVETSPNFG